MIHWFNNNVHFNTSETAPTCPPDTPDKLLTSVSSSLVRGEGCCTIQLIFPNPWNWKVLEPLKYVSQNRSLNKLILFYKEWGSDACACSTLLYEANSVVFTFLVSQLIGSNSSKSVDKLENTPSLGWTVNPENSQAPRWWQVNTATPATSEGLWAKTGSESG